MLAGKCKSKRSYLSSIVQASQIQGLASGDLNVAEDDGGTVRLALRGFGGFGEGASRRGSLDRIRHARGGGGRSDKAGSQTGAQEVRIRRHCWIILLNRN